MLSCIGLKGSIVHVNERVVICRVAHGNKLEEVMRPVLKPDTTNEKPCFRATGHLSSRMLGLCQRMLKDLGKVNATNFLRPSSGWFDRGVVVALSLPYLLLKEVEGKVLDERDVDVLRCRSYWQSR